jgi:hypothetical protein
MMLLTTVCNTYSIALLVTYIMNIYGDKCNRMFVCV